MYTAFNHKQAKKQVLSNFQPNQNHLIPQTPNPISSQIRTRLKIQISRIERSPHLTRKINFHANFNQNLRFHELKPELRIELDRIKKNKNREEDIEVEISMEKHESIQFSLT